tara:strand:+ start:342 stop:752 length:411 start_codon:yes stop_codon:yes gene_type:complete
MSTAKVNTLTGTTTAGSIAVTGEGNSTTTNLQQGLAKSWISYESVGTVAIRDSFNSAGLTDNGTGDLSHTVTNAMGNVNYSHVGSAGHGDASMIAVSQQYDLAAPTTTVSRYQTCYANNNKYDPLSVNIALLGDLA